MSSIMYYITDWNIQPGYYKFDKHRFPQGYIEEMPWLTLTWRDVPNVITGTNNVVFANTPLDGEMEHLLLIKQLIEAGNRVFIIQEGYFEGWYEWSAPQQELYVQLLAKCTAFVCDISVAATAKIYTDRLIHNRICANLFTEQPRGWGGDYVFIINPIKGYQLGMVAHKIVHDTIPPNIPVYSMAYKRPIQPQPFTAYPDAYKMPGIQLLDPCTPDEWVARIFNSKFGVDITRNHAGGNSILEYASMGIPLVGNDHSSVQQDLFPDLCFDYRDKDGIGRAINRLLVDQDFYNEVATKAHQRAKTHWNTQTVVAEFKSKLKQYL